MCALEHEYMNCWRQYALAFVRHVTPLKLFSTSRNVPRRPLLACVV